MGLSEDRCTLVWESYNKDSSIWGMLGGKHCPSRVELRVGDCLKKKPSALLPRGSPHGSYGPSPRFPHEGSDIQGNLLKQFL